MNKNNTDNFDIEKLLQDFKVLVTTTEYTNKKTMFTQWRKEIGKLQNLGEDFSNKALQLVKNAEEGLHGMSIKGQEAVYNYVKKEFGALVDTMIERVQAKQDFKDIKLPTANNIKNQQVKSPTQQKSKKATPKSIPIPNYINSTINAIRGQMNRMKKLADKLEKEEVDFFDHKALSKDELSDIDEIRQGFAKSKYHNNISERDFIINILREQAKQLQVGGQTRPAVAQDTVFERIKKATPDRQVSLKSLEKIRQSVGKVTSGAFMQNRTFDFDATKKMTEKQWSGQTSLDRTLEELATSYYKAGYNIEFQLDEENNTILPYYYKHNGGINPPIIGKPILLPDHEGFTRGGGQNRKMNSLVYSVDEESGTAYLVDESINELSILEHSLAKKETQNAIRSGELDPVKHANGLRGLASRKTMSVSKTVAQEQDKDAIVGSSKANLARGSKILTGPYLAKLKYYAEQKGKLEGFTEYETSKIEEDGNNVMLEVLNSYDAFDEIWEGILHNTKYNVLKKSGILNQMKEGLRSSKEQGLRIELSMSGENMLQTGAYGTRGGLTNTVLGQLSNTAVTKKQNIQALDANEDGLKKEGVFFESGLEGAESVIKTIRVKSEELKEAAIRAKTALKNSGYLDADQFDIASMSTYDGASLLSPKAAKTLGENTQKTFRDYIPEKGFIKALQQIYMSENSLGENEAFDAAQQFYKEHYGDETFHNVFENHRTLFEDEILNSRRDSNDIVESNIAVNETEGDNEKRFYKYNIEGIKKLNLDGGTRVLDSMAGIRSATTVINDEKIWEETLRQLALGRNLPKNAYQDIHYMQGLINADDRKGPQEVAGSFARLVQQNKESGGLKALSETLKLHENSKDEVEKANAKFLLSFTGYNEQEDKFIINQNKLAEELEKLRILDTDTDEAVEIKKGRYSNLDKYLQKLSNGTRYDAKGDLVKDRIETSVSDLRIANVEKYGDENKAVRFGDRVEDIDNFVGKGVLAGVLTKDEAMEFSQYQHSILDPSQEQEARYQYAKDAADKAIATTQATKELNEEDWAQYIKDQQKNNIRVIQAGRGEGFDIDLSQTQREEKVGNQITNENTAFRSNVQKVRQEKIDTGEWSEDDQIIISLDLGDFSSIKRDGDKINKFSGKRLIVPNTLLEEVGEQYGNYFLPAIENAIIYSQKPEGQRDKEELARLVLTSLGRFKDDYHYKEGGEYQNAFKAKTPNTAYPTAQSTNPAFILNETEYKNATAEQQFQSQMAQQGVIVSPDILQKHINTFKEGDEDLLKDIIKNDLKITGKDVALYAVQSEWGKDLSELDKLKNIYRETLTFQYPLFKRHIQHIKESGDDFVGASVTTHRSPALTGMETLPATGMYVDQGLGHNTIRLGATLAAQENADYDSDKIALLLEHIPATLRDTYSKLLAFAKQVGGGVEKFVIEKLTKEGTVAISDRDTRIEDIAGAVAKKNKGATGIVDNWRSRVSTYFDKSGLSASNILDPEFDVDPIQAMAADVVKLTLAGLSQDAISSKKVSERLIFDGQVADIDTEEYKNSSEQKQDNMRQNSKDLREAKAKLVSELEDLISKVLKGDTDFSFGDLLNKAQDMGIFGGDEEFLNKILPQEFLNLAKQNSPARDALKRIIGNTDITDEDLDKIIERGIITKDMAINSASLATRGDPDKLLKIMVDKTLLPEKTESQDKDFIEVIDKKNKKWKELNKILEEVEGAQNLETKAESNKTGIASKEAEAILLLIERYTGLTNVLRGANKEYTYATTLAARLSKTSKDYGPLGGIIRNKLQKGEITGNTSDGFTYSVENEPQQKFVENIKGIEELSKFLGYENKQDFLKEREGAIASSLGLFSHAVKEEIVKKGLSSEKIKQIRENSIGKTHLESFNFLLQELGLDGISEADLFAKEDKNKPSHPLVQAFKAHHATLTAAGYGIEDGQHTSEINARMLDPMRRGMGAAQLSTQRNRGTNVQTYIEQSLKNIFGNLFVSGRLDELAFGDTDQGRIAYINDLKNKEHISAQDAAQLAIYALSLQKTQESINNYHKNRPESAKKRTEEESRQAWLLNSNDATAKDLRKAYNNGSDADKKEILKLIENISSFQDIALGIDLVNAQGEAMTARMFLESLPQDLLARAGNNGYISQEDSNTIKNALVNVLSKHGSVFVGASEEERVEREVAQQQANKNLHNAGIEGFDSKLLIDKDKKILEEYNKLLEKRLDLALKIQEAQTKIDNPKTGSQEKALLIAQQDKDTREHNKILKAEQNIFNKNKKSAYSSELNNALKSAQTSTFEDYGFHVKPTDKTDKNKNKTGTLIVNGEGTFDDIEMARAKASDKAAQEKAKQDAAVTQSQENLVVQQYIALLADEYDIKLKLYQLEAQRQVLHDKGESTQGIDTEIGALKNHKTQLQNNKEKLEGDNGPFSGKSKTKIAQKQELLDLNYADRTAEFQAHFVPDQQIKAEKEYTDLLSQRLKYEQEIANAKKSLGTSINKDEKKALKEIISLTQQQYVLLTDKQQLLEHSGLLRLPEATAAINDYKIAQQKVLASTTAKNQGVGNIWQLMGNDIKRATTRIFDYGVAYTAMNKVKQAISQVIQLTKQLDSTMTNLRIVTNGSKEDATSLMISYQNLGKALGATTQEVATAATEWLN